MPEDVPTAHGGEYCFACAVGRGIGRAAVVRGVRVQNDVPGGAGTVVGGDETVRVEVRELVRGSVVAVGLKMRELTDFSSSEEERRALDVAPVAIRGRAREDHYDHS